MIRQARWLLEWMMVWPVIRLVQSVPQSVAFAIGRNLGRLGYWTLTRDRQWCLTNLELVFGDRLTDRERRRLAMAIFVHHGLTICEILRMDEKWIAKNVHFEGTEQLHELIARKERMVIVGGHLGNWEIFGACWKHLGHHSVMLSRPLDNPYIENEFQRLRARYGQSTVSRKAVSLREGIRKLREGWALGVAIDVNIRDNDFFIDFLGIPASTAKGAAVIALKENASIFSIAPLRQPDGTHRLIIEQVEVTRTGDFDRDVQENMQRLTNVWGKWVASIPEQWHWQHARWRSRPAGSDWYLGQDINEMLATRKGAFISPPRRCKLPPEGVRQPQAIS